MMDEIKKKQAVKRAKNRGEAVDSDKEKPIRIGCFAMKSKPLSKKYTSP